VFDGVAIGNENDRKRTESHLSFRFFSVALPKLTELIHLNRQLCRNLTLNIQTPFRAFRDFPLVPLFPFSLDLFLQVPRQHTGIAPVS
jgi:hypothetical protein